MNASVWNALRTNLPCWGYTVEGPGSQAFLLRQCRNRPLDPALREAVRGLLLWALREHPLEGEWVRLVLAEDAERPLLNEADRALLRELAVLLRPPVGARELEARVREAGESEAEALLAEAAGRLEQPAEAVYWLGRLWHWSVLHAAWPRFAEWLDRVRPPEALKMLWPRLEAQARLMRGDWPGALEALRAPLPEFFDDWRDYVLAEGLRRAGDEEGALRALGGLWKRLPWHVNLLLKTHSLARRDEPLPKAGPDVAVALYTWNKAELFAATLEHLAQSELGQARLTLLDNGSSDATPEVVRRAGDLFGEERLTRVRLPVNVGAPPARNWILSLPEVRDCSAVAFVDDDALVPKDWLGRLLRGVRECPEAGAIGGRVLYVQEPRALQMTDLHLLPPSAGDRLSLLNNALGEPDLGLHDYRRPALSVTGCCHLLTRRGLDAVGGFNVGYNPSQLDDLDRDLRLWLAGVPVWYDGGMEVRHHRRSGPGATMSGRAGANALGNRLKLEANFGDAEIASLRRANEAAVWDDLTAKAAELEELFGSSI